MGRYPAAGPERRIYGLQLVLVPLRIDGIIAFSPPNRTEAEDDQALKDFAPVVLEDVSYSILPREILQFLTPFERAFKPKQILATRLDRDPEHGASLLRALPSWLPDFAAGGDAPGVDDPAGADDQEVVG